MKTVSRLMINILSNKLEESKSFYTSLFDFEVDFDSDWFIHLISKDKQLELGIIQAGHSIVPESTQPKNGGYYVTLVVDNADEVFKIAKARGLKILSDPEDTFYGQRRLLLEDPNGTVVDVFSPIPNFQFG